MSISGGMDKQIVVYTYNGILLILKVEWSANIGYNIDELENIMLSGKKNWQKPTYCMIAFIQDVENRQIHQNRE